MDKKTLALLGVVLIVVGIAGLFLSSGYSRFTYGGYSPQWGGYGGTGPGGMMGGGMMGGGMMGGPSGMMGSMMQMMGGNMLVSGGIPYNQNGSLVSLEQAGEIAKKYLAAQNNPDLEVADLEEWEFNFYIEYKEKSTGTKAFQMLIDKYSGSVSPEMGPNMMWNTKYGMMGSQTGNMTLTKKQTIESAQQFLDSRLPGTKAEDSGVFYGYYHFDVKKDNKMYGMMDVNGYSGQIWYHTWHGNFIRET